MKKVNLDEKFARFDAIWSPRIVAESNGQLVKLARGEGTLVRHTHDREDELFLVLSGRLCIAMDGGTVELGPGELLVVPRGTPHCPTADPGTRFIMIEPASTAHTGEVTTDQTVAGEDQEWI